MHSDGRSQAVANRPNAAPPYQADLCLLRSGRIYDYYI